MNTGAKLWNKAKNIIPGGGQLLSKRSEKFLPDYWPSYYSKAKGCEVWDLDNNHYYDFAQMGVGSCVIGYADDTINKKVSEAINNASMNTLNSYEEVELAEKLIELHPWAEMARFSKTGGEANVVAIRIARAATGRDKIAFCGYHGWHDWYIAANLSESSNLDNQLLPGLNTKGVPSQLAKTIFPFNYNRLDELSEIVKREGDSIAAIIMEPVRSVEPDEGFLEGVREIANNIGAVLIFDEVTSGFRMNCGGIHLTYNVAPDIAVFGKALGNGYPISAILGIRSVMDIAQETFISSTFWTERIGFVAGLATTQFMEVNSVPEKLIEYGNLINDGWKRVANKNNISINVSGIPPLTHIHFEYDNSLAIQTLFCQEMLSKGFLAGAAVYTTYSYSYDIIEKYIAACDEVFAVISDAIKCDDVEKRLNGPIMHSGFKRLT